MTQAPETTDPRPARVRRGRIGLFLPFGLLLLVVALWSAGWVWVRGRAAEEIDGWFAREAQAGRSWTCADRSVGGYPFRLELRCTALRFARSDVRFTVGPVVAVAQVYQPRHVIVEATGPFHVEQDGKVGDVEWRLLEGSAHLTQGGFQRVSLVVDGLKGQVAGVEPQPIAFTAGHLEVHARPTPGRFDTDGAVDLSARVAKATLPLLDPLLGGPEPADLALDATVNRAAGVRTRPLAEELERWRVAGGSVDLTRLNAEKGKSRLQVQGSLRLDEAHRLAGDLDVRTAGLDAVIAPLITEQLGGRIGGDGAALIGNLVGQFLGGGRRREPAPGPGSEGTLKPLPPVRLVGGRVAVGPFAIPNLRLDPLY
ncbi:DUF2125 domain-containing protein [Methylobacterium isbiliense]|jgi:hypothetical protein|uniref:DUF2125 domain-containing protein n=1 Tax=Methylobacterium isbiliense TaxID=315478 RepID=A0ABQ4SBN8_9HYPH|nr:DUF2125 domain-containing protein [Methylobacterium isbiliense]MDN3623491.1 DUF2125 domain-containing protein [Methylobacterium isbiliense]GJD99213.1 hypothetical protein GMJLKIPL_1129 [Methylobacterium isbiliense]